MEGAGGTDEEQRDRRGATGLKAQSGPFNAWAGAAHRAPRRRNTYPHVSHTFVLFSIAFGLFLYILHYLRIFVKLDLTDIGVGLR